MRIRVNVVVMILIAVLAGGVLLGLVGRVREMAAVANCQNNLRSIGLAIENHYSAFEHYPPATRFNPDLPPDRRLSWQFELDPFIHARMDPEWNQYRDQPWNSDDNLRLARQAMPWFACPKATQTDREGLWITSHVGSAGVGADAAGLQKEDTRSGVFGHERRVRQRDLTDGIGQTALVLETAFENGPWMAGGFSTTRGIDPTNRPFIGPGRQFGGYHRGIAPVLFADGSVQAIHESIDQGIFQALFTIAGGDGPDPADIRFID